LGDVTKGSDPAAEKQAKRKAETVGELLGPVHTPLSSHVI